MSEDLRKLALALRQEADARTNAKKEKAAMVLLAAEGIETLRRKIGARHVA